MSLDDVDRRLLDMLKEDGRASFVELAERLNLSEAAVRRRVKRLLDRGVIRKFTVELGIPAAARAITLVAAELGSSTSEIARKIKSFKGVERVYEITGQYDIAAFIRGGSITEVNSTIDNIRSLESVVNTNTIIILRDVL